MKDRRRLKFCFQEHIAVEAIHRRWTGRERTTALAIYGAMTYLASVRHKQGGRDGFTAGRAEIAEAAGSKPATIDAYARVFEDELGLIRRDRKRDEHGRDLPSEWALETPSGSSPSAPPVGVPQEAHRGPSSAPEEPPPTRAQDTALPDSRHEEEESLSSSVYEVVSVLNTKHGQPDPPTIAAILAAAPDRDHLAVARRCAHWIDHEASATGRLSVAGVYRTFLERAEPERPSAQGVQRDWSAWVREHMPELADNETLLAVAATHASRTAHGGANPDPDQIRHRMADWLGPMEVA